MDVEKLGDSLMKNADKFRMYFKGKCIVVDPCYVVPNEIYDNQMYEYWRWDKGGVAWFAMLVEDNHVLVFATAYGDGRYPVYAGGVKKGEAAVDSGSLCIIPMELLEKFDTDLGEYRGAPTMRESCPELGVPVTIDGMFEFVSDGVIKIGNVLVDTD
jgi:hypothetical protein